VKSHSSTLRVPALVVGILSSPKLLPSAMKLSRSMDVLEFRYDLFPRNAGLNRFTLDAEQAASRAGLKTILTVRSAAEGGGWIGSEKTRLAVYETLSSRFDMVDVELMSPLCSRVSEIAVTSGVQLILSLHDFSGMPSFSVLDRLLLKARRHGATWSKFAVTARKQEDIGRLAAWTMKHSDESVVTIAMGRFGAFGRYSMWLFGSRAVYGTVGRMPLLAGQLNVSKLRTLICCSD